MRNRSPFPKPRGLQQGVSLLFALMSLVILGFAAVALTRSVDTGVLIMGNLSFKQDTLVAGSSGTEQAILWLQANINSGLLDKDQKDNGYYSARSDKLDPTGGQTSTADPRPLVNWDGTCGAVDGTYLNCDTLSFSGTAVNGNRIKWVITRLCDGPGPAAGTNQCVRPAAGSSTPVSERGELTPGGRITSAVAGPFFRIIVRIEGPRNTVSFTESLVHF